MVDVSRREFLKAVGAAGVAAAIGSSAGLSVDRSRAGSLQLAAEPVDGELVPNVCRMCTAGCSILVRVRDGKPERIMGNPRAEILNASAVCARGNMGIMRVLNPDRPRKPLVRTSGTRGSWGFQEAGWGEAIARAAEALRRIREEGRPDKLIIILGEVGCATYHPHAVAFAKTFKTPNVISIPLSTCIMPKGVAWGVTGLAGKHTEVVPDYARTRYFLSFGRNLGGAVAVGQTRKAGRSVRRYKLVVLDPRLSEWAAKADEWIQIRPGTDLAFLLAMINVVIEERLYDGDYLARYTNAPMVISGDGYAPAKTRKIKKSIAGKEVELVDFLVYDMASKSFRWASEAKAPALELPEEARELEGRKVRTVFEALAEHVKEYTPEWAAEITGVPAETIRRIAREFAATKPAAVETGWNTNKYWNGFQLYRAAAVLAALTGNLLVPGGVVLSTAGIKSVLGRAKPPIAPDVSIVKKAEVSTEIVLSDGTRVKGPLLPLGHGYLGLAEALKKEKGWVILVVGANPAKTFMGGVFKEIARLPTVEAVIDIGYSVDDTVLYSDVFIPECAYTERSYNIHGFPFTTAKALRAAFKAHDPPPGVECKGMLEILLDLLAAVDEKLVEKYAEVLAEELGVPKCAGAFAEAARRYLASRRHDSFTAAVLEAQARCMGVDLEKLKREGVILIKPEEWGLEMNRRILENGWLNTPTGKVEILPLKILGLMKKRKFPLKPEWHPLPTWVPPRWLSKQLADDEFTVVTGKVPTMSYTSTYNNPLLATKLTPPEHKRIWIHPSRAAGLGIRDGDIVEVCGESGKCFKARVWVTEAVHPDAVYIPPHYGPEPGLEPRFYEAEVPPLAELTRDIVEPVTGAHLMSDFRVKIRKA
ncbi:molybdopterin-containing oxidoreductase family protein [Pyrodictium abyssi]|uniref:Molybdopterin-dependent oxidoreductase n=1 Tax=Pyrodictium abyssi TaxID=54256 RepID=A0ABM8IW36_9CREN|nr:molybdopterin-dependent oxidoreductase [Pyrodictium abyssi]